MEALGQANLTTLQGRREDLCYKYNYGKDEIQSPSCYLDLLQVLVIDWLTDCCDLAEVEKVIKQHNSDLSPFHVQNTYM